MTFTAGYQKIFSDQPRVGFLAEASHLQSAIDAGTIAAGKIGEAQGTIFNDRLDAAVCGMFLIMVTLILVDSLRVWCRILSGTREVDGRRGAVRSYHGCKRRNYESVLPRRDDAAARDRGRKRLPAAFAGTWPRAFGRGVAAVPRMNGWRASSRKASAASGVSV